MMVSHLHNSVHNLSHFFEDDERNAIICHPEHLSIPEIQYELYIRNISSQGSHRADTLQLRQRFQQERLGTIPIPHISDLPPNTDIGVCVAKISELESLLQSVSPNNGFNEIFMSRYTHLLNRVRRINTANNNDISLQVFTSYEQLVEIRERFIELVTAFRTRDRLQHTVVNGSVAGSSTSQPSIQVSQSAPIDAPIPIVNVTHNETINRPSGQMINVSDLERIRFQRMMGQLSDNGELIQNESMLVNTDNSHNSNEAPNVPTSNSQYLSVPPAGTHGSGEARNASMSENNANITLNGFDSTDFRHPASRSSEVYAPQLFGNRVSSLDFRSGSQNITVSSGATAARTQPSFTDSSEGGDSFEVLNQILGNHRTPHFSVDQNNVSTNHNAHHVPISMPTVNQIDGVQQNIEVVPLSSASPSSFTVVPPQNVTYSVPSSIYLQHPNTHTVQSNAVYSVSTGVTPGYVQSSNYQPTHAHAVTNGHQMLNVNNAQASFTHCRLPTLAQATPGTHIIGNAQSTAGRVNAGYTCSPGFFPQFASSGQRFPYHSQVNRNSQVTSNTPIANQTYIVPPPPPPQIKVPDNSFRRTAFVPINKWRISFSGKLNDNASNLIIFLQEVELRQRMYGISDDELFANFLVLLDGPAKLWYLAHIHEFANWMSLREALYAKYIGKMQHSFFLAVTNRKQSFGETIGEFFADMLLKMSSIPDLNEERRISILLNGLLPVYRNRVTGFRWESISALEEFLTTIEADIKTHSNNNDRNTRFARGNHVSVVDSDIGAPDCSPESLNESVNESESACCVVGNQNPDRANSSSAYGNNTNAASGPLVRSERGKCFKCGEEGHLFRQCTRQRQRIFCFNCGEDNDTYEARVSKNSQPLV